MATLGASRSLVPDGDHETLGAIESYRQGGGVGFSGWYISSLERGRRNPTIISLYELANAIGVSVADLIDDSRNDDLQEVMPAAKRGGLG